MIRHTIIASALVLLGIVPFSSEAKTCRKALPEIRTLNCGFITFWSIDDPRSTLKTIIKRIKEHSKSNRYSCKFSKGEVKMLAKLVLKGYFARQQSKDEHRKFVAKNSKLPKNCRRYTSIGYKKGWTIYKDTKRYYNSQTGQCVETGC